MAKEVTHAVEFRDPIQPSIGPDKLMFVVTCDDGSIYEFQRLEDAPIWNLRSRGGRDTPKRDWTSSGARLPGNVTETLNNLLGRNKWNK